MLFFPVAQARRHCYNDNIFCRLLWSGSLDTLLRGFFSDIHKPCVRVSGAMLWTLVRPVVNGLTIVKVVYLVNSEGIRR